MDWRHYETWKTGKTCVIDGDFALDCRFDMGAITTGRQRVFHRYYIRIHLPDGSVMTGEAKHNVRAALFALDRDVRNHGMALLAAGIDERFEETGLSHNSGYGYLPEINRPVHVMELPPPPERDHENDTLVENMIREAVDGMFLRPAI